MERLRPISENEPTKTGEKLPRGHKLILAGPAFLLAFAFSEKDNTGLIRPISPLSENTLKIIFLEYSAIHKLLSDLVGEENIVVARNKLTLGKSLPSGMEFKEVDLPQGLDFNAVEIPFLKSPYQCWPRDAYSLIDSRIVASGGWNNQEYPTLLSPLGEGGKVLARKNALLVTPDIWKKQKGELGALRKKGFKIGCLPFVEARKQKYEIVEDHIDGQSSLIEDKEGQLRLLIADSYANQGNHSYKSIRQAADEISAQIVKIDDRNLPPMALNLLQFSDRSVVLTSSETNDLKLPLSLLLGEDRVFTTDIPIVKIPEVTGGSLRCLTNTIPPQNRLFQFLGLSI